MTVQSDNVAATAWMDSKVVMVMYTNCDPKKSSSVLRRNKDGSREPVPCPEAIKLYNEKMGGVDRGDQLRGYYHVRMRCRKVYKYIFNFLFDVSITNAFITYRESHPTSKLKMKDFRIQLANELVGDFCSRSKSANRKQKRFPMSHFPYKDDNRKRGQCSLCREKKKRTDTMWSCHECDIWLCHQGNAEDCFLKWHCRQ